MLPTLVQLMIVVLILRLMVSAFKPAKAVKVEEKKGG
jgi:hypothetical protein